MLTTLHNAAVSLHAALERLELTVSPDKMGLIASDPHLLEMVTARLGDLGGNPDDEHRILGVDVSLGRARPLVRKAFTKRMVNFKAKRKKLKRLVSSKANIYKIYSTGLAAGITYAVSVTGVSPALFKGC